MSDTKSDTYGQNGRKNVLQYFLNYKHLNKMLVTLGGKIYNWNG